MMTLYTTLSIYTRRKEVTDYLLELVQKEDQNCTPADAECGNINCAYRITEVSGTGYPRFPFNDVSGDLITDDYTKAL